MSTAQVMLPSTIGLPVRRRPPRLVPVVADFRIVKQIGSGAFGTVWLAEETLSGAFRAIKVLHHRPRQRGRAEPHADHRNDGAVGGREGHRRIDPADGQDGGDGDATLIERELAGLHAFATHVQGHAHLIQIYKTGLCTVVEQAGESGQQSAVCGQQDAAGHVDADAVRPASTFVPQHAVYYVMEIADHAGGARPHHPDDYEPLTLAALLRRERRLPVDRVLEYAAQLLDAIEHLHRAGINHRDIKPANILFVAGVLKLADLGLASTGSVDAVGTTGYLPPEGKPDDLYAFGKVLYEMLTDLPAAAFPEWPGDLGAQSTISVECENGRLPVDSRVPAFCRLINDVCHPTVAKRLSGLRDAAKRISDLGQQPTGRAISRRQLVWSLGSACVISGTVGAAIGSQRERPADSFDPCRAAPPYDGSTDDDLLTVGAWVYVMSRTHRPAEVFSFPGMRHEAALAISDIDSRLLTVDGQVCVVVAGRFDIRTTGNPANWNVRDPRGAIHQVYLAIGNVYVLVPHLLYNGQPGAHPGARGRFVRTIPIEALVRTGVEAGKQVEVRFALFTALSPAVAETNIARELGEGSPRFALIGILARRPA